MKSYQLTKYESGSIAEIWHMSWPLILSMFSITFMIFIDRVILAKYSLTCLNAVTRSSMAAYVFIMGPMALASITEVFCGKYHGSNMQNKIGSVVWQVIWLSIFFIPFFLLVSNVGEYFFKTTSEKLYENQYFSTIVSFGFIFMLPIAFGGFFSSQGKVYLVTFVTFFGSLVNVVFDYILIFGFWKIPSLGVKGAALGTVLAQIVQVIIFLCFFLSKKYQKKCNTIKFSIDKNILFEVFKIGGFLGISRIIENLNFFIFFTFLNIAGELHITIASVMQSIFALLNCYIEGFNKALSSIISNFIGAREKKIIAKTLKSAYKLFLISFIIIALSIIFFFPYLKNLFYLDSIFNNENGFFLFKQSLFLLMLFFLFEGLGWIFKSLYIAYNKTKLILYITIFFQWTFILFPTYMNLKLSKTFINSWYFVALNGLMSFVFFLFYYKIVQKELAAEITSV